MTEWTDYEHQSTHQEVEYAEEALWGPNPIIRWVVRPIVGTIYCIWIAVTVGSIVMQMLFSWGIALAVFLLVLFGVTTYIEHMLGITY